MNTVVEATGLAANLATRAVEDVHNQVADTHARTVNFLDPEADPLSVSGLASRRRKALTSQEPDLDTPDLMNPAARTVTFMPSQIGTPDQVSISYTATPLKLLWYDCQLILGKLPYAMGIMKPWRVGADADPFDEMYPNGRNLFSIGLHAFLLITQFIFVMTMPWFFFTPVAFYVCYFVSFILTNTLICIALNGTELKLLPEVDVDPEGKFHDEYWIYLNGVSVGRSWLLSNINRLSLTFGRPVVGIHNSTGGIIFDLFQCLVQRNFAYSTQDVREAYACIKAALLDPSIKKIVFILHSQGGIEGGLILDWLFAEVSRDALKRLEVYTFGNAANHFNNPDLCDPQTEFASSQLARSTQADGVGQVNRVRTKVLGHIEHYANAGDFVSQFGVLNYTRIQNRYMGRLFLSPGSGHLLNQHYLYKMFSLNQECTACADTNDFMEMEVRLNKHDVERVDLLNSLADGRQGDTVAFVGDVNAPIKPIALIRGGGSARILKVKDFSRLWLYRNGGEPDDN